MRIGILTVEIFMSNNQNLKQKRMILKSLKEKLRNNFNISLLEVDNHDKWQRATLAIAALGTGNAAVDGCFANIIDFLERNNKIQLIDYRMEII